MFDKHRCLRDNLDDMQTNEKRNIIPGNNEEILTIDIDNEDETPSIFSTPTATRASDIAPGFMTTRASTANTNQQTYVLDTIPEEDDSMKGGFIHSKKYNRRLKKQIHTHKKRYKNTKTFKRSIWH